MIYSLLFVIQFELAVCDKQYSNQVEVDFPSGDSALCDSDGMMFTLMEFAAALLQLQRFFMLSAVNLLLFVLPRCCDCNYLHP